MRPQTARQRRARKQIIFGTLLLVGLLGIGTGLLVWKLKQPKPPTALLCPAEGAKGHVAVLVDKTDPLSFTQGRAFQALLDNLATGKIAQEGELLSVFVLGEDFKKSADPLFER